MFKIITLNLRGNLLYYIDLKNKEQNARRQKQKKFASDDVHSVLLVGAYEHKEKTATWNWVSGKRLT